jgi:hypothetical protein
MSQPTRDDATPLPADTLRAWATRCFATAGMTHDDASLLASSLVQTSLWGIDSHGVALLPHYLDRLANGTIKAQPRAQIERTGAATALVHADQGHGIVIAHRAMAEAVRIAREQGVGAVGVKNASHCGAIGLYTRAAARDGCVGLAFTHADSVAVPHGGKRAFLGTNPISFAFPRGQQAEPLCLDMATTSIPFNRVRNARREGHALPPDVAVDADGAPTTDANTAAAVVPVAASSATRATRWRWWSICCAARCSETRTGRTSRRCSRPSASRGSSARSLSRSTRRALLAARPCRRRSKRWRKTWRLNRARHGCRAIRNSRSRRSVAATAFPSSLAWPNSFALAARGWACRRLSDLQPRTTS